MLLLQHFPNPILTIWHNLESPITHIIESACLCVSFLYFSSNKDLSVSTGGSSKAHSITMQKKGNEK